LDVTTGSLDIQGIPVKYWRYSKKKANGGDEEEEKQQFQTLIALHGGPGWPHSYLLPLKQLACRMSDNAEVIFYDQAGCGESIIPPPTSNTQGTTDESDGDEKMKTQYPHLLDPKYYSEIELPTLIDHWNLTNYHVLGHSWGTILAQLFALNYINGNNGDNANVSNTESMAIKKGLQSLILSGPISNAHEYITAQWDKNNGNLGSLPPFIQGRIHMLENERAYESAEYEAINEVLTSFFTMRTSPPPDCFTDSAEGLNGEIYVGMQGASEFTISGVLGDLDLLPRLHEINIPVLLTHGQFDTMRPSTVINIQDHLTTVERVMFPHSGHVSMIDDTELMNDAVADFLFRVENGLGIGMVNVSSSSQEQGVLPVVISEDEGDKEDEVETCAEKLFMWMKIVATFVVGFIIGAMKIGRRRNGGRNGYAEIV
jgi:pimeloyl-ACP methyl ester carboxylesterase